MSYLLQIICYAHVQCALLEAVNDTMCSQREDNMLSLFVNKPSEAKLLSQPVPRLQDCLSSTEHFFTPQNKQLLSHMYETLENANNPQKTGSGR